MMRISTTWTAFSLTVTMMLMLLSSFLQRPVNAASAASAPYDDLEGSYAKQAIIALTNRGILTGTSKSTFSPKKPVTRAEFVTMLDRLLGLAPVDSPVTAMKDMKRSDWYYGWIQAAMQLGLAEGTSPASFEPMKPVSRQEAAVLLTRALKQAEQEGAMPDFQDGDKIADWAKSGAAIAQQLDLVRGNEHGAFQPMKPILRQEAAVMLHRVVEHKSWDGELTAPAPAQIHLGWQYGQSTAEYERSVAGSTVNTLSPRWYFVGALGNLTDTTDSSLVAWAKNNNKQIWAMVGNRSDEGATHQLLSDAAVRVKAVQALTAAAKKHGLQGLNIDFENVGARDRAAFTAFITELGTELHAAGKILSVNVSPDRGTSWTEAFDYAALGRQADYIVMMGYDEHWGGQAEAGSVASISYVDEALRKLSLQVPGSKMILALPFYNRDWALDSHGRSVSSEVISLTEQNHRMKRQPSFQLKWDGEAGQYRAAYRLSGVQHRIWMEDGRSLAVKIEKAQSHGAAGLAYWYVGGESSDIWPSVRNAERFAAYNFTT
ncbi:glycosyl hydrolase family 18 protein [Paenibacillus sp. GCM10023252]|uniref:glycosyl hydrolase family 18 protein n=1 Tax=Paenibacillus sp. GCM10023252 TaxID=3252649 RepID=UPI00361CF4B0